MIVNTDSADARAAFVTGPGRQGAHAVTIPVFGLGHAEGMALKIMLAEQEEEQRKWREEEEDGGRGAGADAAKGAGAGRLEKVYTLQMECEIQVAAA